MMPFHRFPKEAIKFVLRGAELKQDQALPARRVFRLPTRFRFAAIRLQISVLAGPLTDRPGIRGMNTSRERIAAAFVRGLIAYINVLSWHNAAA